LVFDNIIEGYNIEKSSFELALIAYLVGWFPIYFLVGIVVTFLGWSDNFLLPIVISVVIFLIFFVPLVDHLEKKNKKF